EVPAELLRLSQVEEMLISQVIPMLTVFNLQDPATIVALVVQRTRQDCTSIVLYTMTLKSNVQRF
ncbi:17851_t:CDS:2, partial [Gigaspora rosea]